MELGVAVDYRGARFGIVKSLTDEIIIRCRRDLRQYDFSDRYIVALRPRVAPGHAAAAAAREAGRKCAWGWEPLYRW